MVLRGVRALAAVAVLEADDEESAALALYTLALDFQEQSQRTEARLIENLRSIKGITMLLVTHRTAMLPLVDRLVVLDHGAIVADGPREEVLQMLKDGRVRAREGTE